MCPNIKPSAGLSSPYQKNDSRSFDFYLSRSLESPHYYRLIVRPKRRSCPNGESPHCYRSDSWTKFTTLPKLFTETSSTHGRIHTLDVWLNEICCSHLEEKSHFDIVYQAIAAELRQAQVQTLLLVCGNSWFGATMLVTAVRHSVQVVQFSRFPPLGSCPRYYHSFLPDFFNRETQRSIYQSMWKVLQDFVMLSELRIVEGPPIVVQASHEATHDEFFRIIIPRLHRLQLRNITLCVVSLRQILQSVEQNFVIPDFSRITMRWTSWGAKLLSTEPFPTLLFPSHFSNLEPYIQFLAMLHTWRRGVLEQRLLWTQQIYHSLPHTGHHVKDEEFGRLLDAVVVVVRDWYRD